MDFPSQAVHEVMLLIVNIINTVTKIQDIIEQIHSNIADEVPSNCHRAFHSEKYKISQRKELYLVANDCKQLDKHRNCFIISIFIVCCVSMPGFFPNALFIFELFFDSVNVVGTKDLLLCNAKYFSITKYLSSNCY